MVVKGLDIPGVTLVGIISADSLLSFPDFRVNERAFQLMEQVSGRAGRFEQQGKVLIQAYNLGNQVLGWVQTHDLNSYYKGEIPFRAQFQYPPFTRIIKIIFKHEEEQTAIVAAQHLVQQLQVLSNVEVQGPTQAVISRIKNLYIQEVWLKCPKDNKQLDAIKATLLQHKSLILNMKGHSKLSILFDVDPA
jgi:primosomal protein N' (replication factor Y)